MGSRLTARQPTPHWHWVTYGLTALYDKPENEDPDWSGWGFELTMRGPVYPREVEEVQWPMTILRGLGNHAAPPLQLRSSRARYPSWRGEVL